MKHPMRDTQLEQIRELGCEILDQLSEVCSPTFALHPLTLDATHIQALRGDANHNASGVDWITVAGVLGKLTDDSSPWWAKWNDQPREWCARLWLKTYHIEELADCYDSARSDGFKNDETSTVRLRVRFEELHRCGSAVFQAIDYRSAEDVFCYAGARGYDIAGRAVRCFLADPYAVFWDRRDRTWFTWLDFGRGLSGILRAERPSLSPQVWAALDELETELDAAFALGSRFESPSPAPPLLPNFDEVLAGEPLLATAKRIAKDFRTFGENRKALRVYAKSAGLTSIKGKKLTSAEIKEYVVGRALYEAIEDCTTPQRIRLGSHAPFEQDGAFLSPYDHFRDDPRAFSSWLKSRTLSVAAEILRTEGASVDDVTELATPQDKIDAINVEQESGEGAEDARADIAMDGLTVLMGFATEPEREFLQAAHTEIAFAGRNLSQEELAKRLDRTPGSVRQVFSRLRARHREEVSGIWHASEASVPAKRLAKRPKTKTPKPAYRDSSESECATCRAYLKKNPGAKVLLCKECGTGSNAPPPEVAA